MFKKTRKLFFTFISMFLLSGFMSGCGSKNVDTNQLAIVVQPQNITIDNGDKMEMKVVVNNPNLVKSYQWYNAIYDADDQQFIKPNALIGTKAKTDTYSLPSYYEEPAYVRGFKCVITDINGKQIETDWASVHVNPGKETLNQYMLGDYTLPLGKTFDLSTTPFGTGTITINETGDYFTFDNVMYTNEFMDSNFGGFGFKVITFNKEIEGFTFEFKGNNCFQNVYWNEDMYDGGTVFQVQAMELELGETRPALFKGDGSVVFYGGTYGIYGNYIDIYQDIDMNFYGQPGKCAKGLYASNYTLCKGRVFSANVSSVALDIVNDVTLEEGSKLLVNLSVAPVSSISLNHLSCVATLGDININSADIKINVLLNAKKEFEGDYTNLVSGLTTESNINIENSRIDFFVKEYNNDFEPETHMFVSAAAISAITAIDTTVSNSIINIDIDGKFISEARGLNCGNFEASECYININISAGTAGGICCYKIDPPEGIDLSSTITCFNTNIDINLNSKETDRKTVYPFHDSGLYACDFVFSSTKKCVINVNTEGGIPTICHKFKVLEDQRVKPHEGYTDKRIDYENATITSNTPFVHNEQSYDSASLWDVVFESLYEDLGSGNYQFIDNLVISY